MAFEINQRVAVRSLLPDATKCLGTIIDVYGDDWVYKYDVYMDDIEYYSSDLYCDDDLMTIEEYNATYGNGGDISSSISKTVDQNIEDKGEPRDNWNMSKRIAKMNNVELVDELIRRLNVKRNSVEAYMKSNNAMSRLEEAKMWIEKLDE